MASLITKIKQWKLDNTRQFNILAWDQDSYQPVHYYHETRETMKSKGGDKIGQYYLWFEDVDEPSYIHPSSVALHPCGHWDHVIKIKNDYENYCAANLFGELDKPEMRVLVHMKFRGMQGGNRALFSDRENVSKILNYTISAEMRVNHCVVFEYELSEDAVRNYFYVSDDGLFVNSGKPTWVK